MTKHVSPAVGEFAIQQLAELRAQLALAEGVAADARAQFIAADAERAALRAALSDLSNTYYPEALREGQHWAMQALPNARSILKQIPPTFSVTTLEITREALRLLVTNVKTAAGMAHPEHKSGADVVRMMQHAPAVWPGMQAAYKAMPELAP